MSDVDDEMSANASGTSAPPDKKAKNMRPLSVSPTKWNKNLHCLPGGCCLKCKEELGSDSKAVQCNLYAAWIHVTCEGLSDEVYDNIMVLGELNNVVYYCGTNNCISHIKHATVVYLP